ncbi:hypothetical protein RJ639_029247 [Escallonia herrerae]|uniref:Uncharacterized protein n=1 Tax=Escallonia herrerae TaxID=1293975 RepID=A0AA89BG03_9ASTE|nr:hypothetical protein RJ639_029247 [Escallonia herrerae]
MKSGFIGIRPDVGNMFLKVKRKRRGKLARGIDSVWHRVGQLEYGVWHHVGQLEYGVWHPVGQLKYGVWHLDGLKWMGMVFDFSSRNPFYIPYKRIAVKIKLLSDSLDAIIATVLGHDVHPGE